MSCYLALGWGNQAIRSTSTVPPLFTLVQPSCSFSLVVMFCYSSSRLLQLVGWLVHCCVILFIEVKKYCLFSFFFLRFVFCNVWRRNVIFYDSCSVCFFAIFQCFTARGNCFFIFTCYVSLPLPLQVCTSVWTSEAQNVSHQIVFSKGKIDNRKQIGHLLTKSQNWFWKYWIILIWLNLYIFLFTKWKTSWFWHAKGN